MDDVLPLIMHAYCKPTLAQMPLAWTRQYIGDLLLVLEHNRHIAHDASLVCKKWHQVALVAQRKAVKAMREAFFAKVVEFVLRECQAPAGGYTIECVLRHVGVTTTVVGITTHKINLPQTCYIYVKHYPVDAEHRRTLTCMQPSADGGTETPPIGYNVREGLYRLHEMPHYSLRDGVPGVRAPLWLADFSLDACRSEQQHKETHTWLAALAQQVLQGLLEHFAALNERDWHRQRFRG
jgi:hypothetical protein